jgi:hypothetical protein
MAVFGLAPGAAESYVAAVAEGDLGLWPENEATVTVFMAMNTQWQVGGMGGVLGLRYEALPTVLRLTQVPRADWPDVFSRLQVMEGEALRVMNGGAP